MHPKPTAAPCAHAQHTHLLTQAQVWQTDVHSCTQGCACEACGPVLQRALNPTEGDHLLHPSATRWLPLCWGMVTETPHAQLCSPHNAPAAQQGPSVLWSKAGKPLWTHRCCWSCASSWSSAHAGTTGISWAILRVWGAALPALPAAWSPCSTANSCVPSHQLVHQTGHNVYNAPSMPRQGHALACHRCKPFVSFSRSHRHTPQHITLLCTHMCKLYTCLRALAHNQTHTTTLVHL